MERSEEHRLVRTPDGRYLVHANGHRYVIARVDRGVWRLSEGDGDPLAVGSLLQLRRWLAGAHAGLPGGQPYVVLPERRGA
jgi:hypothetical protein